MRKKILAIAAVATMTGMMSMTAFAAIGSWQKNDTGWWWQREGGSYPTNQWMWIDGNADGTAECYYFGPDGYMYANTTTPDGYTVNANGAWTVNGVVQSRATLLNVDDSAAALTQDVSGAVTDASAVGQITIDEDVLGSIGNWDSTYPFDMNQAIALEDNYYQYDYNGVPIKIRAKNDLIIHCLGPAKAFVQNIPENGIEVNAFFVNSGLTDPISDGYHHVHASTGNADHVFGVSASSLRMLCAKHKNYNDAKIYIQLTQGADGNWYLYPDSSAYVMVD